MSFFSELKRRNVFRVGAAYLVLAWLLLQVMDTVGPIIGLSDAFARGVLFILAVGFPIVLVLSWVYEMTPEGVHTQKLADSQSLRSSGHKLNTVIIAGLALALVFVVLDAYVMTESSDSAVEISSASSFVEDEISSTFDPSLEKSIAVLPFTDLSQDGDQEYFSDGLSEELLNKLAGVDDLLVTSRTSSFYFKGREETIQEIAGQLDVNYVLEGSVRKSGDQLRITAQLIQARDDVQLWSDTFDRNLENIFDIQDEIASAVTTALSITLGAGEFNRVGMTRNTQAYDLVLQANAMQQTLNINQIRESLAYAEQAVNLDPASARLWLALRESYQTSIAWLPINETEGYDNLADEALERARNLAPGMPELLRIDARLDRNGGDLVAAENKYLQILQQNEFGDADTLIDYGSLLLNTGQIQEGLAIFQRARRLDPLSPEIIYGQAMALLSAGRIDDAREAATFGFTLENLPLLFFAILWQADFTEGNLEAVGDFYANFNNDVDPDERTVPQVFTDSLGYILLEDDIEQAIAGLRSLYEDPTLPPAYNAMIAGWASALEDPAFALEVRMNTRGGDGFLPWFGYDEDMRRLPLFKNYVRDKGYLDYWRGTGNWGDFCRPLEGSDDFECF